MGSAVIPKQNALAQIPPIPKSWKGKRRKQSEIRPNEAGWETKPPAGHSFRHGIAVTPPSKREAVESHA